MKKFLQLAVAAMIALPMIAVAHGPTRQTTSETITINAPVDKVWQVIQDFGGIHNWHPEVASTEMQSDETRVITLNRDGNPTITETLTRVEEDKKTIRTRINEMSVIKTIEYNSVETPYFTLPVSTYSSWLSVKEVDGQAEVQWRGAFYRSFMNNPPVPEGQSDRDAVEAVSAYYAKGLEGLKAALEN